MAETSAQRMQRLRARRQAEGLATLTITVPAEDIKVFRDMAATACRRIHSDRKKAVDNTISPGLLSSNQERKAFKWAAEFGSKARISRPGAKLAELLSMTIGLEIYRMGFPVGRMLGSEEELRKRYDVSRNVLREAIRILEQQTLAVMIKGPSGGLVVTEPKIDAASYIGGLYLESRKFMPDQMLEMRRMLELFCVERVIDRLDTVSEKRLLATLEAESDYQINGGIKQLHRFHLALADLTDNPAIRLFLDILLREFRFHNTANTMISKPQLAMQNAMKAHRHIVEGILARDKEAALAAMNNYLDTVKKWLK